jgi:hypothetical protein
MKTLSYLALFDLDPAANDSSLRAPEGETLLGRDRDQLVCPLIQGCVISDEPTVARGWVSLHGDILRLEQVRNRLPAGGSRIRTIGPA